MNLVKDDIKKRYYRYLADAFGSSLISTIYGRVDSIVIGKYAGPDGSAARAVMAPLWNIVFSFGLLFGIGGSVFFQCSSRERKRVQKRIKRILYDFYPRRNRLFYYLQDQVLLF